LIWLDFLLLFYQEKSIISTKMPDPAFFAFPRNFSIISKRFYFQIFPMTPQNVETKRTAQSQEQIIKQELLQ
jgi:hypothetical protein